MTIEEYINSIKKEHREKFQKILKTIEETVPEATLKISYQMPTFYLNGNLIHVGYFKNHIGIYPTPSAIEEFSKELKNYDTSKGTIKIKHEEEITTELIIKIVEFRKKENKK